MWSFYMIYIQYTTNEIFYLLWPVYALRTRHCRPYAQWVDFGLICNLRVRLKLLPAGVCVNIMMFSGANSWIARGCACGLARLPLDRGIVRVSGLSSYMFSCGLIVICLSVAGFICLLSTSEISDFSHISCFTKVLIWYVMFHCLVSNRIFHKHLPLQGLDCSCLGCPFLEIFLLHVSLTLSFRCGGLSGGR